MNIQRLIGILSVFTFFQAQAWVSVGSSPGFGTCTYSTVQQALDSNESEIRVLNNQEFIENLEIDHSVEINGGFTSCLTASLNQTPTDNTVIKGSAVLGSAVITIESTTEPSIKLNRLTLSDAVDTVFTTNGGHGLEIGDSNGLIELKNVLILNNTAEDGGGIYMANPSGNLTVILQDSTVLGNTASGRGGGIFCANANTNVRVSGNSLIGENSAEDGGGIAALNGCAVTVDSGTDLRLGSDLKGVIANTASQFGGGVYLNSSARLSLQGNKYGFGILGNNSDPVTLANNTATSRGGGIYAINSSHIEIIDGFITNNTNFSSNGGGIFLGSSSTSPVSLIMQSSDSKCWSAGKCSILSSNKSSGNGGGVYLEGAAEMTLLNTFIIGNRANFGTAIYVSSINGSGTTADIQGSYLYSNGNNGADSISDNYVIRGNGEVEIILLQNTIVNNDVNDSKSIIGIINSNLTLKNSIIRNGSETVLEESGTNTTDFSCLMTNENISISAYLFSPEFVDESNHDYHLGVGSNAIDLCPSVSAIETDTENETRGWDDYTFIDFGGPFDAGADETYINDILFINGFE